MPLIIFHLNCILLLMMKMNKKQFLFQSWRIRAEGQISWSNCHSLLTWLEKNPPKTTDSLENLFIVYVQLLLVKHVFFFLGHTSVFSRCQTAQLSSFICLFWYLGEYKVLCSRLKRAFRQKPHTFSFPPHSASVYFSDLWLNVASLMDLSKVPCSFFGGGGANIRQNTTWNMLSRRASQSLSDMPRF